MLYNCQLSTSCEVFYNNVKNEGTCKLAYFMWITKLLPWTSAFIPTLLYTLTSAEHDIKRISCPSLPLSVLSQFNLKLWHNPVWLQFTQCIARNAITPLQWWNCVFSLSDDGDELSLSRRQISLFLGKYGETCWREMTCLKWHSNLMEIAVQRFSTYWILSLTLKATEIFLWAYWEEGDMLYNYCNKTLCRRNECKRTRQKCLAQHSEWLNQEIVLPSDDPILEIPALTGRPKSPFQSSSDRSKRRKNGTSSVDAFCPGVVVPIPVIVNVKK
jgi:hypothetical protein